MTDRIVSQSRRAETEILPHQALLIWLAVLFSFRVLMQVSLWFFDIGFLPSFDAWHSATIPYQALLAFQIVIVALMMAAIRMLSRRRPRPVVGKGLIIFGVLYFGIMIIRMALGASNLLLHRWIEGALPTVFHFVLAAFLIVFGAGLCSEGRLAGESRTFKRLVEWCAYPTILIFTVVLYGWLEQTGSPSLFAAYLAVAIGVTAIVILETLAPHREDWRPARSDVWKDGQFLLIVQILLPLLLKALALVVIVWVAGTSIAPLSAWWPHQTPIAGQVALMFVVVEFFRYWLHRAMHTAKPLWQLHAVHHAADKLYTINVARFHPLDKALQFLADTFPFLLLGIAPEVFTAFFVVHSVHGFFQHSNASVRLGLLNWIVAGPELHRWHHSILPTEARSNYGNNLIIWDVVFGSRFLPRDRRIGDVGISNRIWPSGFAAQMLVPFRMDADGG